jgi:hypothetical protein
MLAPAEGAGVARVRGMDVEFDRKVRAAVSAGVRVFVVEVGLLTLVWAIYLAVAGARPGALLAFWGPDASWTTVTHVTLLAIAAFKVALWLQAAVLAWGWVWASMLRRMREEGAEHGSEPTHGERVQAGS